MANPLLDALLADREGNSASGFSPMSAPTPAAGARMIDFATPLPEMTPDAASSEDTLAFPEEVDQTYTPLDAPEPAETSAEIAPAPRANPLLAALKADQAATQQAVAEAATPDDRLPVIRPELADALGVLDYRDPQEGQRRQQAAAVGEILNLPMFERVNLGAAPVNADGTVTIRRAQAVSPEAQAAADARMANIRTMAAGEMLVEESPKEVGTLQGIANAAQNAFDSARQALMATDGLDANDASEIARIEYNKAARRVAPGYAAYQQAEGWDAAKAFAKNPFEVTTNIITEGLAGSWPALAGGLATGATTAAVTGVAGSVVPGVGNVIGAGGGFTAGMIGGTGAGSFATEYGGKILEELQTAGMNPKDPESIANFFSNETLMAKAKDAALKRGVPVAAFDALSAGIAGRVGSVFRAAAKTPVRLAVTEAAIQGGLGGAGEVAGSVAAGDPVNPKAVFGEVIGEVGPAAIEIAAGRAASAAPAEVPQNFTPISSPAPAPGPVAPAPAPQNLGQVRAPEIPIDQAALDEAFGSPFAPPQPAPADPFAPTPEAPAPQRPALSFSTDAITPEQTALATDFSARLTGQLRTQGILDTASTLDLAPVNLDRVDAGAPLADFIDNFSRLTGTRIQFVKASDPTIFGGAVRSDDAQTIYLNADSQRPVASLIGHEFGHTLQYSNPALYKDLRRVVATYTDSYRARARESAAAPIYRTGPATQRVRTQTAELTNNTLGDAFLDPEFWRSVQNENRPLLQKLWTSFNEWIDSLLTRQSQATWGTPQFATDLTALRRDLAKTIAPALRGMENANATEQSILEFAAEPSNQQPKPQAYSDNFKNWFGDWETNSTQSSKVVDEAGQPLVVYHGTRRPDRVERRFQKKRATSGPMAFFTDSPEIGSSYATGKADTSLEMPSDYAGWFKYKGKGMRSAVDIDRAWWSLSPEERNTINQRIYTVGYQNPDEATGPIVSNTESIMGRSGIDYELRKAKGNGLRALTEIWLNSGSLYDDEQAFMQVLQAAGMDISKVNYDSPHAVKSAVYPVYLSIKNPLDTSNIPADVVSALEQAGKRKRAKISAGNNPDAWDKNTISGQEWLQVLRDNLANGTSTAWTRIPDWVSETLSLLGYDGIKDTGGKMGGDKHAVWIPFEETQVKSATGNKGTFNPESSYIDLAAEPSARQNILDALPRRGAIVKRKAEVKEDGSIYYNGKEPSQWSPEDFEAYGEEFGVRNLGPLSKLSNIVDELGRPLAEIPGGLDGKFTYYDLLHLKANPVDVKNLPVELHGQLTAKLARTMTPEPGNNVQKFNGIVFGMLSPNSPLLPNEFGQARMRFGSMEEIKRFASLLPENPTKEQRQAVNKRLKDELGFTSAKSGGLGIGISVDLSNIVMASKLFVKNPDFFIKKPSESWANFVDKLTTQVSGLGTKTASFGGVWQDPLNAGISAMDRHMARAFSEELVNNPDIRGRFEGIVVSRFNDLLDESKKTSKKADAKIRNAKSDKAKAKAEQDKAEAMQNLPDPTALKADTLDDVLGQAEIFGGDRIKDFINEAVFAAMGSRKAKYQMKGGQINPNLPESIQGVEWVKTPKDFQVMSEAYRLALEINAKRAKSIGIEIFPAQWTLWDGIRGRVEPHEAMFPGLEKLPALNDRQLSQAFTANKQAGYAATPRPGQAWKRKSGIPASSLAYFAAEPRSFPQTVAAAPGVAPEVKAQLTALDYDPISNAQTLASARARIDAAGSMDSAVTQFMGNAANPDFQPTAVDYATGIELLGQLQSRGRHEDAAAIADFMARAGTTQGQAIQALSLISRLTPAGIEAFAARQITRAARNDPKIEELIQDNQRLRAEIAAAKRDSATAAIVDNRAAIKAALPAGTDAVATNIAIREAILQSPTPLAAQAATARILQDNGLSERAAIRIAQSITKDFLKTTTDSRAKVLQDLLALAEKDRRFNKSKIGSLIRLNREGKLTDSRLHADMAKMLGIPAWTPEHSAKVQDLLRQREAATDPRIKLVKAAEALDVIYRESMPAGMLAKIDTFQTLMMLLNPKTWIRNIGGNAFMFGADLSADTVAWGADAAVSIVTGNRTRTGLDLATRFSELGAGLGDIQAGYEFARTQGMGRLGSFKEGVQTLIRLGRLYSSKKYDSAEITGFTGTTFQSGIGKVLEDTLGAALTLVDRGFYQSAFRASLDNQMRLAAQDGPPLAAPTPDMIAQARMDASRAVYQDENAASRTLSGLRRVLNANQRWGLGSMLMKFTQVPGSILMRGIEFSPLGFIRNAYQLLAPALSNRVAFDQKAFTEQFSRALVGTTGLVATGYWLAQLGIISAGRENEDEKKRNLAKAEGWGSYKLNVSALKRALITGNFWTRQPRQDGDVVVNYDWAQPLSISVAMGAYAKENQKAVQEDILRGKKQSLLATGFNWMSAAAASATGAMNALVEQPLLSGLSTFFRNAAYDDIPGAILAAASDVPKSLMPTAARQWMQLDDNTVRETRDSSPFRQYVNELKSQLPGLSQTLPAKRDILGEDVERYQRHSNTVFNVLFNPSMVTYIKKSPLLTEMSQVYEMTGNPSVIPNQAGRDFTIEGVKVRLTTEEISALQKDMGALSVAAVEKFVLDDPRYDKATWDIKAKAFTRALEKAATAAKYRILLSRPDLKQRAQIEHQQTIQRRQEMQQMMDSGVGAALMQ